MIDSAPAGSSDASDASDELGVAAVHTGSLLPLWPESPPLVGRASTVRLDTGTGTTLPETLEVVAGAADHPDAGGVAVLALASALRAGEEHRLRAVGDGGGPRLGSAPRPETPRDK